YLNHSDRRFGLLNTPTPKGDMVFASPAGPGWASPAGDWDAGTPRITAPLHRNWVQYRGLHITSSGVVLEYTAGKAVILESFGLESVRGSTVLTRTIEVGPSKLPITVAHNAPNAATNTETTPIPFADPLTPPVTTGGPNRWGEPIVTKLARGDESGPFSVDTLTIPHKNPFGALFFCTGLDFLPDGRIAV